jgi:hypothetical protein
MLYGQLSNKADVYSFGVLLLETISGKKNQDPNQPKDEVYLPIRVCESFNISFGVSYELLN